MGAAKWHRRGGLILLVAACLVEVGPASAGDDVSVDPATTWRASVPTGGLGEPNGPSGFAVVSADGAFVAFNSSASNLVPDDTNEGPDVFVHERETRKTIRVSVATGGAQVDPGFMGSTYPSISWDGRYVAFASDATGLVPGVAGNHVYVHDLQRRETLLVSVSSAGMPANGGSRVPAISGDGRFVAFESVASNLVPDDTNGQTEIFLHDLLTRKTTRVSVASDGTQANSWSFGPPSLSVDGRHVAFFSAASNLVPGDTNGESDIFIHDRLTDITERVSVGSDGQEANHASESPALSADGRVVAFKSWANNLGDPDTNGTVDVYMRDRTRGTTTMASVSSSGEQANGVTVLDDVASKQAISADGRYLVMRSWATNLAPGASGVFPDVFVHDWLTRETWRASVNQAGLPAPGLRYGGAISADGRHVAFQGTAPTLVAGAANPLVDAIVRSRGRGICAPPLLACILDR